jgi:hypothetical protein
VKARDVRVIELPERQRLAGEAGEVLGISGELVG